MEARYLTSPDYAALVARADIALIPLGAVEVHGPHLPLGADGIATEALARRVAERVPAIIAPTVTVGMSRMLGGHPGTLWVDREAFHAYTIGIARALVAQGSRRLLFLNGHSGNTQTITDLAAELEREGVERRVRCAQIDWWRFVQPLVGDLVEAETLPHGHAAELGTSVMLVAAPDAVRIERAGSVAPNAPDPWPDFLKPRLRTALGPTGMVGDATRASAAKGEETLRRAADRVVAFLQSPEFA